MDKNRTISGQPITVTLPVAQGQTLNEGSLVCVNSLGYVVNGNDTSGYSFAGICKSFVDNSNGQNGEKSCLVDMSHVELIDCQNLDSSMIGKTVFLLDSLTVGASSDNSISVGVLVELQESNKARVLIRGAADLSSERYVVVNKSSDFPAATNGVRTLPANTSYYLTSIIDLEGDRIECEGIVSLAGTSSETCFLKSTGLTGSLITSNYSIPMRNLSITAENALHLDANGNSNQALDWFAVNFVDTPNVGVIKDYTNATMISCAWLNSGNTTYSGSIGTIGGIQCLFDCHPSSSAIFIFPDDLEITRRVRWIYSAWIVLPTEVGISMSVNATIPTEGYILDSCNFGGGGSYVEGVPYSDNKARFNDNRGINNSAAIAEYYMNDNATVTDIVTQNIFVKVSGSTTSGEFIERFDITDNRATHRGALTGFFKVTAIVTATGTNNDVLKLRIAKNGTTIPASEGRSTMNASGRAENIVSQTITEFIGGNNDYVEVFVANGTATNDFTVVDMNVIVERLN